MGKQEVLISQIRHGEVLDSCLDTGGLVALYQAVFREAPYFESFTSEEVKGFFYEYLELGRLFIAKARDSVVGFSAMQPLVSVPEVRTLLDRHVGPNVANSHYFADLGVRYDFRGLGYGRKLTEICLGEIASGETMFVRTSINNVPSLSLYRSLGFTRLADIHQEVEQTRVDGTVQKDTRVLLVFQK